MRHRRPKQGGWQAGWAADGCAAGWLGPEGSRRGGTGAGKAQAACLLARQHSGPVQAGQVTCRQAKHWPCNAQGGRPPGHRFRRPVHCRKSSGQGCAGAGQARRAAGRWTQRVRLDMVRRGPFLFSARAVARCIAITISFTSSRRSFCTCKCEPRSSPVLASKTNPDSKSIRLPRV